MTGVVHVFGAPARPLEDGDRLCSLSDFVDAGERMLRGEVEAIYHVDAEPAGGEWWCPKCGEYSGVRHDA